MLPGAAAEAAALLDHNPEMKRVSTLIEGFEKPYSMELLATVHWLAGEDNRVQGDSSLAISGVQAWNEHKKLTFSSDHIQHGNI